MTIKADEWPFSKLSAVLTIPFLDGELSCGACGAVEPVEPVELDKAILMPGA